MLSVEKLVLAKTVLLASFSNGNATGVCFELFTYDGEGYEEVVIIIIVVNYNDLYFYRTFGKS